MSDSRPKILLIDDESSFRGKVGSMFGNIYHIINAVNSRTALLAVKNNSGFNAILLDLYLDSEVKLDGLDLILPLKKYAPNVPIIVISKETSQKTAITALKLGADDFVNKDDFDAKHGKKLLDKFIAIPIEELKSETSKIEFIGEDEKIQKIKKYLLKLSEMPDMTVLLTGESGVGKEVAARFMHEYGVRAEQPFEAVNPSTNTQSIIESILFGHKKGSFTDAKTDRIGVFEKANNGILFLDEIGEINHDIQVKLLRFLEDKVIEPIGGNKIKLDVQIVAATNKDLKLAVQNKTFREDLYYRLNQFPIEIPSLRDRRDDIPLLIDFYLEKKGYTKDIFTHNSYKKLLEYDFPGNIRELVNVISTLIAKVDILELSQIDESILPIEIANPKKNITQSNIIDSNLLQKSNDESYTILGYKAEAALTELKAIEEALIKFGGKKGDAAKSLDMSMDNIRYKIETSYKKHPEIFTQLPKICERYKL